MAALVSLLLYIPSQPRSLSRTSTFTPSRTMGMRWHDIPTHTKIFVLHALFSALPALSSTCSKTRFVRHPDTAFVFLRTNRRYSWMDKSLGCQNLVTIPCLFFLFVYVPNRTIQPFWMFDGPSRLSTLANSKMEKWAAVLPIISICSQFMCSLIRLEDEYVSTGPNDNNPAPNPAPIKIVVL